MSRYIILPATESTATHRMVSSGGTTFHRIIDTTIGQVESNKPRVDSIDAYEPMPARVTQPRVRQLSKLTLRRRIRNLGKETAFDAALDSNPQARRDWDDANVIRTDDPMFTTQAPAFKTALGLTDAQFASLLA